jgi:D-3-phosphoglycerate dehydrogenase
LKILFVDKVWLSEDLRDGLKSLGELTVLNGRQDLHEPIRGADVLVSEYRPITADLIQLGGHIKAIHSASVGYNHIDVEAASARGIYVTNVAGVNAAATAEYTFALILNLLRHAHKADRYVRDGLWTSRDSAEIPPFLLGETVEGHTIGIVGLGRIGKRVARTAAAFGLRILSYDPLVNNEIARSLQAEPVSLETLLRESDIVTLHLPLTEETEGIIGAEQLSMMKKTAVLVNAARGGLIVEEALIGALTSGKIAAAALDVFSREPLKDSPLLKLENVVLSRHLAGNTVDALHAAAGMVSHQISQVLKGHVPDNCVNLKALQEAGFLSRNWQH